MNPIFFRKFQQVFDFAFPAAFTLVQVVFNILLTLGILDAMREKNQ